jgi:outer membrane lipoprotein-sorting protein
MIGCGKYGEKDVVKDLTKKIENAKGYHLTGVLEMINNEDSYLYDVDVSYEKDEKYRVSLKNKTNNHEQIILRNDDGVYVLTPSLNKSFKFQSEWPYNNSQSYLLQTLLKDIKNDKDRKFKENDKGYVLTTKVNYSSNKALTKQNIYLDKNLSITEVHVLNEQEQVQIKMKFDKMDMKATYDQKYFTLKENMATAVVDEDVKPVSKIDDVIYPMYIPNNTHLASQDKITKENGERIILTFSGDKPFMLVQETAIKENELLTIPMYGEPVILTGTVAAISESSITWVNNGIEYYVVSDVASEEELLNIARSVSVMPVGK